MEARQIRHELRALGMRVAPRRHLTNYYLLIELFYLFSLGSPQQQRFIWQNLSVHGGKKGGNYFHFSSC